MPLFIRLIICTFQLVFSAGTVFFSHHKSLNSIFQPAYQHSRTGPIYHTYNWEVFSSLFVQQADGPISNRAMQKLLPNSVHTANLMPAAGALARLQF
jgi:hypothetical protein